MAITYIDWRKDKNFKYKREIEDELAGIEFNEDGDDFIVYYNDENGKYAVYYKLAEGGRICSLAEHFDLYSRIIDTDDGFSDKLYALFEKEARENGFPLIHPRLTHYMTWRELRDRLNEFPDRILDMTAWVYVHSEATYATDGEFGILNVTPTYSEDDFKWVDEDNHMSISIDD